MSQIEMFSDTRRGAHDAIQGRAANLRAKALDLILNGPGLTAEEVAGILEETVLAIRPRITELRKSGFIIDTGQRRRNTSGRPAAVWRAA